MSPRIVTFSPAICPFRSRMVKASSSAWVGCSCAPSPALMTLALSTRARKCGAPDALWRMTMKSALSASRLRAVSLSVSPFLNDEASAVKLMMSADSRCSASSKLMRVRVDGSTNRLTTVLPRSAGTFLMARSPTALNAARRVEHGGDFLRRERFDVEQMFAVPAHFIFSQEFLLHLVPPRRFRSAAGKFFHPARSARFCRRNPP
jgi:hypothetical protein